MAASKRILVIAGSDSSGGAGLEADQKVIAAHGCYAMTATTALTAQNTQGVQDIHHIPPAFLKKQLDAVCDDVGVDVVKTGMLASAETIEIVADALRRYNVTTSVVDPVMVSTSGSHLLPESAISTLIDKLLPLTTVLTPNLPEAELLLKTAGVDTESPKNMDDVVNMAKRIQQLGPEYVLLKGGHLPFTQGRIVSKGEEDREIVLNVLVSKDDVITMESEYLHSKNTHGTGCSLASAIACNLTSGMSMAKAVAKANRYIEAGIKTSVELGKGRGPINHFHSTYTLPFSQGGFIQYLLDRDDIQRPWEKYTEHEFVQKMGDGSLPLENYKHYLIQDYLFLVQFARATALGAYKSSSLVDIGRSVQQVVTLQEEIKLHIDFCKEQGLSVKDIESQEEDQATTAYTRYVLDIGQSQDWLALQVALLPCLIGYGIIAKRLFDDASTLREGKYWTWIQQYVDTPYVEAMARGSALIEEHASKQSVARIDELAKIFIHATNMERGFWDMGMRAGRVA
ncbi:Phosphomethylpyrimidine kinase-domain-containing protein [Boeremia exigua]|uniref:Phosphomethylpyrimidine kinase-domain-containing protein n=1 Tax=Boeremia exigua TaxID=749465 RepID=UPI001E8EB500|nr:Phosphomethylpyrimidine kinase-domain-containing protein [Boeremia exigua]KAH6616302.1 Phosphomethylpyrimidine kinase-domain-containing protein [Boeremia exigua]